MTKKTTINKIVSSKAFWIIISLLASFLLWTYIMSTEETTIEMTFSNVKVVYQGADDLRAANGVDDHVELPPFENVRHRFAMGIDGDVGARHLADPLQLIVVMTDAADAARLQFAGKKA